MVSETYGIRLTADNANFNRNMRSSKASISGVTKGITGLKLAVAAIVGVGTGFGLMVKKQFEVNDALAKTADKLGINIQKLKAIQLQNELYGISTDKTNSSLDRMVKRLGEAANGQGSAAKTLKDLNLNAQELISLAPDEAYLKISGAVRELGTQYEKNAAVAALFGREGISLVSAIDSGTDSFIRAQREVKDFGTAITRDGAAKIEAANDSMTRARESVSGLATRISQELAPYVERAGRAIQLMVKDVNSLIGLGSREERLNQLFKERGELLEKLAQRRTGQARRQNAEIRERINSITEEMNLLINKQKQEAMADEERRQRAIQLQQERAQAREQELNAHQQFEAMKLQISNNAVQVLLGNYEKEAKQRLQIEQRVSQQITNLKLAVAQNAIGFLQAVAGDNKRVQKIIIIAEKGLAIAQVKIQTEVAAMRALAELGPVAGTVAAGRIRALGGISMGLIAGTGLAQISGLGNSSLGGYDPVSTTASNTNTSFGGNTNNPADPFAGGGSINIYIQGGLVTPELVQDQLIPSLQDLINNRDVVLIHGDSRQASVLQNN